MLQLYLFLFVIVVIATCHVVPYMYLKYKIYMNVKNASCKIVDLADLEKFKDL